MHPGQEGSACQHTGIARNNVGEVAICVDCNIVHLTLQHMTLRLSPEAFRSLSQLLAAAQGRLDEAWQARQGQGAGGAERPAQPLVH